MSVLITNVRIVDGTGAPPRADCAVEIRGDRITSVGDAMDSVREHDEGITIDGTGLTLVPGLIDCHVHLSHDGEPDWTARSFPDAARETLNVIRNAVTTLHAGVTTVRDCGSNEVRAPLALALADGLDAEVPLPRVVSCGTPITITGGHLCWEAIEADGPEELRKAVRKEVKGGAQWIKVVATGGVLTPGTDVGRASFDYEEILAVTSEAERAQRKVAAHAIGSEGIKNAVKAGVRTIEHGSFLDEEAVNLMLEHDVAHVPTLAAYHHVVHHGVDAGIPAQAVGKAMAAHEANLESFRRSLQAGVTVIAGSDAGTPYNPHGALLVELALMVDAGATPLEAIRSATASAAIVLGLDELIGTIQVGKIADVVLVEGDPVTDIGALARTKLVIRDGKLVSSRSGIIEAHNSSLVGWSR